MDLIELLKQPWPWYVAGPLIAFIVFLQLFFGKKFGISSSFETVCAIGGAGKVSSYFDFDWKKKIWQLMFASGLIIGGYIATNYLHNAEPIQLSESTITNLQSLGIENPGEEYIPSSIFSWESLVTVRGFIFMVLGGFLIGFGTRYAGGCTSGHAISGLSNLDLSSLIAVIGFFIGGLITTFLILPYLLTL